ncbi:MAG: hypothetical protein ACWA5R_11260 [bacterium]
MKKLLQIAMIAMIAISSTTQAADEGIKVHGHWTFNIYNADGSFDRKVEFENALNPIVGPVPLLLMLSRNASMLDWVVTASGPSGSDPCADANGNSIFCVIYETGASTVGDPYRFANMSVSLDNNNNPTNNPTKLILKGSMTTASGITNPQITSVATSIEYCVPATTSTCSVTNKVLSQFTVKNLATPVALTAGQVVQITVEISFS